MASAIITNAFIWHFVALQRRFIVGYQPVLVNSAAGWWVSLFGWLWAEPLTEKALTEKPVTETSGNPTLAFLFDLLRGLLQPTLGLAVPFFFVRICVINLTVSVAIALFFA